ncbi:SMP-30/gluconolactonase/LRE family protein [Variovorax sp. DT-64]|uniref:SMP-30/gluconolactonase/LRE family protein n=1 Tax=Variovorax sp. DT-64 TaxID=3396160 RepID=UPI003F1B4208
MNPFSCFLAFALVLLGFAGPAQAADQGLVRVRVEPFISLPDNVRHPEGLASNPVNREIYVATFDARMPEAARNNQLLRYSQDGRLLAQKSFGAMPLTGIEHADGKLYILNFGASKLQRIDADFTASSPVEDLVEFKALMPPVPSPRSISNPDGSKDVITFGSSGFPAPNGMVFDKARNLYISDSFQGAIYRIERATRCAPCALQVLSRDPLLTTAGALPFGANGLAFNADESALYVNNAGDGRLLRMALSSGAVEIVAESVFGADGLLFHKGLLWIASNQADVVLGLDEKGRTLVRAGEFEGIGSDGAPRGLLFPATTAVQGD